MIQGKMVILFYAMKMLAFKREKKQNEHELEYKTVENLHNLDSIRGKKYVRQNRIQLKLQNQYTFDFTIQTSC